MRNVQVTDSMGMNISLSRFGGWRLFIFCVDFIGLRKLRSIQLSFGTKFFPFLEIVTRKEN